MITIPIYYNHLLSGPLTTPNVIRIQSAILPQYTLQTDRQTDGPTDVIGDVIGDNWVPRVFTLYYTDSEQRANNWSSRQ